MAQRLLHTSFKKRAHVPASLLTQICAGWIMIFLERLATIDLPNLLDANLRV